MHVLLLHSNIIKILICLSLRSIYPAKFRPTISIKVVCFPGILDKIFGKKDKSSKTGLDKKSLVSTFASFLTTIPKLKFLEEGLGTRLCSHPDLRFSYYLLIS